MDDDHAKLLSRSWVAFCFSQKFKDLRDDRDNSAADLSLDMFLTRALSSGTAPDFQVIRHLSRILLEELRSLCLLFNNGRDPIPLKRFFYQGRGWKLLAVLLSFTQEESEKIWWCKEFVNLLLTVLRV